MKTPQTYQNHVRWFPLVHFVIFPILTINLVWQAAMLFYDVSWDRAMGVLVALALVLLTLAARIQALRAQNRIIRLEEQLRYRAVLDPEMAAKAADLPLSQIIPLRFASDSELGSIAQRVADGELKTSKEIKLAIKDWRGDHHRV
jgi:hypothetical protein